MDQISTEGKDPTTNVRRLRRPRNRVSLRACWVGFFLVLFMVNAFRARPLLFVDEGFESTIESAPRDIATGRPLDTKNTPQNKSKKSPGLSNSKNRQKPSPKPNETNGRPLDTQQDVAKKSPAFEDVLAKQVKLNKKNQILKPAVQRRQPLQSIASEMRKARRKYEAQNNSTARTICFVHFHKAGGSGFVKKFREEGGYRQWQPNFNGNPASRDFAIPFWNYSRSEFSSFWEKTVSANPHPNSVEFLAMEWNFFNRDHFFEPEWLRSTAKMDVLTIIRDPYDRFVSNLRFPYDNRWGFYNDAMKWSHMDFIRISTNHDSHERSILNSKLGDPFRKKDERRGIKFRYRGVNYNKPNYYTAFLNGMAENNYAGANHTNYDFDYFAFGLNQTHLEIAKKRLRTMFDVIVILERPETSRQLSPWFEFMKHSEGLELLGVDKSRTHYALLHDNKGKVPRKALNFTREEFYKYNALDKELYDYAVELSLEKLAKLEG